MIQFNLKLAADVETYVILSKGHWTKVQTLKAAIWNLDAQMQKGGRDWCGERRRGRS
jgi:hypothetical protein